MQFIETLTPVIPNVGRATHLWDMTKIGGAWFNTLRHDHILMRFTTGSKNALVHNETCQNIY